MRNLLFAILLGMFSVSLPATETEQPGRQMEALKLIHYTKQLGMFREDIKLTIEGLKERKPSLPYWFWEELEKEVSTEAYAQWLVGLLERDLSEEDLRLLNAVFGDEKKKPMLDELIEKL